MPPNGSATSLPPDTSRQATLTSEASLTCDRPTSPATLSVISSQALPDGPSPSVLPDGLTTDLFGQPLSPVNRSVRPGRDKGTAMRVTSGPLSIGSSASANLAESLANRLKQRSASVGSMEYSLTWKDSDSPAGRRYFRLVASGRRTSDQGSIGWPTPRSYKLSGDVTAEQSLARIKAGQYHSNLEEAVALVTGWPTPMAGSPGTETYNAAGDTCNGRKTRLLVSGWPTPRSEDSEQTGGHRGVPDTLTSAARMSGWPTPTAIEQLETPESKVARGMNSGLNLSVAAQMAGWATPTTRDWRDGRASEATMARNARPLNEQVVNHGPIPDGICAGTAGGAKYRLNPYFSAWLMGFPVTWTGAGMRATASRSRTKRSATEPLCCEDMETP